MRFDYHQPEDSPEETETSQTPIKFDIVSSEIEIKSPNLLERYRNEFIASIILMISFCVFIQIREDCPFNTEQDCMVKFMIPHVKKWMTFEVISACGYIIVIWMSIRKHLHRVFIIISFLIIILQITVTDHTISTRNYSGLILLFNIIILIILAIMISLAEGIVKLYRKSKIAFALSFLIIYLLIILVITKKLYGSCDKWKYGINQEAIQQTSQFCHVREPTICWYDIMHGFMDMSRFHDCTKIKRTHKEDITWYQQLSKYIHIPEGSKYIELPRTEYFNNTIRSLQYDAFQQYFFSQLKFHEKTEYISNISESYLDLNQLKYITKVIKNETLIELRKNLFQERQEQIKHRQLPQTMLIVYIDALSRARLMQKLPNSVKWFGDVSKELNESHTLFQSFRYLSLADYTFDNYIAYEYGIIFKRNGSQSATFDWNMQNNLVLTEKKPTSNVKKMQEAGYIVAKARMQCLPSIVEHEPGFENLIEINPPDHEFMGVTCDPNFQDPKNAYGLFSGPYSIVPKCVYGTELNSLIFDYGKQFLTTYSDTPKYLELQFLDNHEGTGEGINRFDDPLLDFLKWYQQQKYEDSLLMLLSDHGLHMQGVYFLLNVDVFKIEVALPSMVILFDNDLLTKQQQQQQKYFVLTFFELHYFLDFLLTPDGTEQEKVKQNSIVSSSIKDERSCEDIPRFGNINCVCEYQKP